MKIVENLDLTYFNSYRINSFCKRAFIPQNKIELIELLRLNNSEFIFIGDGNNIILSKEYYDKNFVILNSNLSDYRVENNRIYSECGNSLRKLSLLAFKNSLSGLEIFYDIPSSLGGAIVMNAGAYGIDIKDKLEYVEYFDLNSKQIQTKNVEDFDFSYRNSEFQTSNNIILSAGLVLETGNLKSIKDLMREKEKNRWSKQPRNYPNAGSVFKRPEGFYVGAMIEDLELKGFSIGGAAISEKHGGFIINKGNATGKNILDIITKIQEMVFNKYGFYLKVEQRII